MSVRGKNPFYDVSLIRYAYHPLARVIASFTLGIGLSLEEFSEKHNLCMMKENKSPRLMISARNNARKGLVTEKPSFKALHKLVTDILDMEFVSISIKVKNKTTGEVKTYSSEDDLSIYQYQDQK